ncbi:MAG: efflux transporter periplasmic adaptor subunit [Coxiella sp. (in: Bacteria)]|nr:MAG: efflux transporter periplasmic adaptor subunit [Coxiella sp. (in: g-proteobacteria)]
MSKTMWALIIFLVIILAGTIGFDILRNHMIAQAMANFKMPAVSVETIKAKAETWKPKLYAVGTLKAVNGVEVSPEVTGQVMEIHFRSGDMVRKGQPLVQLDDAFDLSQLRNDMAAWNLAKAQYRRQAQLLKTGATSQQAADEARAKMEQSAASVKGDHVTISKKDIRAPFAGKIGIRQVNIGQYINAGQSLVLLQSMKPLFIDFYLPEQDLKEVYVKQQIDLTISAYPKKLFKARIIAINSAVNESTRNFKVRAEAPNDTGMLYPGIFANVNVILPQHNNVVTIPQIAIAYTLYGDSVYLIKREKGKDGKMVLHAVRHNITLGEQRGNVVAILKGLKVGDEIVSAGQVKLQTNSEITINNSMVIQAGA